MALRKYLQLISFKFNLMTYKNILLVDDDQDDAEIFMDAIKDIDPAMHCTVENSSIQALQKLNNADFIPDIIFLDYRMPHLDGLEFLRLLRADKKGEEVRVMIYSGYLDPALQDAALSFSKVGFFRKTENYPSLVEMLRAVIG